MHYYQHHIGDFIKDTANLNDHQLATYMRMVWGYYTDEKPLEDDCESIAFAYRSDEKTVRLLLKHYFVLGEDGWRHARCDKEISEYKGKSEKARSSANARWKNANALPSQTESIAKASVPDANQEPITNNQEPRVKALASPAGSRLPDDWTPPEEWLSWARSEKPGINALQEADKFKDFWHSKAGKDGRKANWQATWRNWIRNAKLVNGYGGNGGSYGIGQVEVRRRNEL